MLLAQIVAASDSRDPERTGAPRPRRARRERRSAAGQPSSPTSATRSKQVTARLAADRTRAGRSAGHARIGRRSARRRRRALRARRHAALRESAMRTPRSAARRGTLHQLLAAGSSVSRAVEDDAVRATKRERPTSVEVPDAGERLILTHIVEDAEHRPLGVMLVVAKPRVPQPGGIDAQLLAQARGPRPALGRHRARDQESAQRDDDPPRAAEDAAHRRAGRARARLRSSRRRCDGSTKSCRAS